MTLHFSSVSDQSTLSFAPCPVTFHSVGSVTYYLTPKPASLLILLVVQLSPSCAAVPAHSGSLPIPCACTMSLIAVLLKTIMCSTVLKFFVIIEQRILHFHFVMPDISRLRMSQEVWIPEGGRYKRMK